MALITYSSAKDTLSGLVNDLNATLTPLLDVDIVAVGFNAGERSRTTGVELELWATTEPSGSADMATPFQVAGFQDDTLPGILGQISDFMSAHPGYFVSFPLIQLIEPGVRMTARVFAIVFYNTTAIDGLAHWVPLGSTSSGGGLFIPLAGTVALNPVTGAIEFDDGTSDTFLYQNQTIAAVPYVSGLVFNADASVGLQSDDSTDITSFLIAGHQMEFAGKAGTFTGVTYDADYSAQFVPLSIPHLGYIQDGEFTFTNKRNVRRVIVLVDGATVAIDADTTDIGQLIPTQNFQLLNPTGTPTDGEILELWITSGAAYNITYDTKYSATLDVALVAVTSGGGLLDKLYFEWVQSAGEWQAAAKNLGGNP